MKLPFTLGCTSLTYPDENILYNLKRIPDFCQAVEITLEYPRSLPLSSKEVDAISGILKEKNLGLTIHLPLSLAMTSANPHMQDASLKTLEDVFRLIEPLAPRAYVLHVTPFYYTGGTPLGRVFETTLHEERLEATWKTLGRLKERMDAKRVAVENLYHNLVFLEDMIREYDYSVCMDTGHLLLNKADVYFFYLKHQKRIKVIHLHDVVNGKDHQELGVGQSGFDVGALLRLMKNTQYEETVILEQFTREHLLTSYQEICKGYPKDE